MEQEEFNKKIYFFNIVALVFLIGFLYFAQFKLEQKTTLLQNKITLKKTPIIHKRTKHVQVTETKILPPHKLLSSEVKQQTKIASQVFAARYDFSNRQQYEVSKQSVTDRVQESLRNDVIKNLYPEYKTKNNIDKIKMNQITSQYTGSQSYLENLQAPEDMVSKQNIPLYYLVTSNQTENEASSGKSGEIDNIFKISVDGNSKQITSFEKVMTLQPTDDD